MRIITILRLCEGIAATRRDTDAQLNNSYCLKPEQERKRRVFPAVTVRRFAGPYVRLFDLAPSPEPHDPPRRDVRLV
jgi:hypothetical protein